MNDLKLIELLAKRLNVTAQQAEEPCPWKYFSYESDTKLACSCCGERGMDDDFMRMVLDPLRHRCGFPFVITSGYRCPDYNEQVSSTGRDGAHTKGVAVDIAVSSSRPRIQLVNAALGMGITRIGIADTFIHIDTDTSKDQNVMWTY